MVPGINASGSGSANGWGGGGGGEQPKTKARLGICISNPIHFTLRLIEWSGNRIVQTPLSLFRKFAQTLSTKPRVKQFEDYPCVR